MAKTKKIASRRSKITKPSPLPKWILAGAVLLTALYASRYIARPQPLDIFEVGSSAGVVDLTWSGTTTLEPDEETILTLSYNSGNNKLAGIQAELTYDPEFITPLSVTPASTLPSTFAAPKFENGKISFTYGVVAEAGAGITGSGPLATIKIKALKDGTPTLTWTDQTMVATLESTTNSLKTAQNLTFTIVNPTAEASPSTASQASPSPAAASPSPVAVSPSPSASTPAIIKPSAPTNLRYNCYDNGSRITLRWDSVSGVGEYKATLDPSGDGNNIQLTSTKTEIDTTLSGNTNYTWILTSVKNGLTSDEVKLDFKCNSSNNNASNNTNSNNNNSSIAPTPTNTAAPKQNVITRAVNSLIKPKTSPSPSTSPSPTPLSSLDSSAEPTSEPGSLSDIFGSPTPSVDPRTDLDETSFISKIFLGWQALFIRLVEALGNL